jgi:hypothetical protein
MKSIKLLSRFALAISVVWTSYAAGSIFLIHAHRTTATGCVQVGSLGTLVYSGDGALSNDSSTENLTIDCPIVGADSGTLPQAVWYKDQSPSTLSCTFRSESPTTGDFESTAMNSGTADSSARRSFDIEATTGLDGYNHYRCVIPPKDSSGNRSGLYGYESW